MKEKKAKLTTMKKTHINTMPHNLCDTIANFRKKRLHKHSASYTCNLCDTIANFRKNVQYNSRNEEKYIVDFFFKIIHPRCHNNVGKWNALPNNVIKSSILDQFRRSTLTNFAKDCSAPMYMYFNFGQRMLNIIHTKLRHNFT